VKIYSNLIKFGDSCSACAYSVKKKKKHTKLFCPHTPYIEINGSKVQMCFGRCVNMTVIAVLD